jgi:hypothetical protein
MVIAVSKFNYGKGKEEIPFVVGPTMIKKHYGDNIPQNMVFSDIRVAGLHPYRGGGLTLSVVLYKLKYDNPNIKKMLEIVEKTAGILDFSTALSSYIKLAKVVNEGVKHLVGSAEIKPLIGYTKEFKKGLESGFFALINIDMEELNTDHFWVRDHQLVYGDSLEHADPFRDADFALYSISSDNRRNDLKMLPFYPLWERVVKEASQPYREAMDNARTYMSCLYQELVLSNDLIEKHAIKLSEHYENRMEIINKS